MSQAQITPCPLLKALTSIVGASNVLTGQDVSARATHFWDATPLLAKAIVRPANTEETSAVLKACHDVGQIVVTHGGVTGLVEGNISTEDDIILSLERQTAIEVVDAIGRTMTVQAGTVLEKVQNAAKDADLQFCLDLGARGSCTIGGNLSTNAGGLAVLRYGMAREQVLGLEAVLADGTILSSMNTMMKNNAGYDLKHLFIGSEGTLGVITRAVLRLRANTPAVDTAFLAFKSFNQVTSTLKHLSGSLNGTLDAFEVIWQPFYVLNTDPQNQGSAKAPLPTTSPLYAIVESRGTSRDENTQHFEAALEQALTEEWIEDAVIAQSEKERAELWHIRENIEIALQHDPVYTYDVSLPIIDMEAYVELISNQLKERWPGVIVYVYGHLADGNLHILVAPPTESTLTAEQEKDWKEQSNAIVYTPLQSLGGSVSAEHGIGLTKKTYLPMSRTGAEIDMMRRLKQAMDPKGILNPGKVI